MANGLMSKLEAVNKILAAVGDTPVSSLEDNYAPAQLALQTLDRVSRQIQSQGWWFNEEEDVKALPDLDGQIKLATNVISAVAQGDPDIVQRGQFMYDKANRTLIFTSPVWITIISNLDWDMLPHTAREHISDYACIVYNTEYHGDDSLNPNLTQNAQATLLTMKAEDTNARDVNILQNPRTQRIANRFRR